MPARLKPQTWLVRPRPNAYALWIRLCSRDNGGHDLDNRICERASFANAGIREKPRSPGRSRGPRRTGTRAGTRAGDDRHAGCGRPWRAASPSMPTKRAPRSSPRCFTDEESALLRFRNGSDASFDAAPSWLYEGMAQAYRSGAARLAITGNDPSLLSQEDPEKVSRANRATSKAYRPALELIVAPRDQLDHRRLRHSRVGGGRVSRSAAGRSAGPALGRHLRRVARGPGRIQWPRGKSTTRTCTRAPTG